jgi:hypothetical protein
MNSFFVTCSSIGNYGHALTKGSFYEVIEYKDDKYRITGNHNKRVWISNSYFIEGKVIIPKIDKWKLDDDQEEFDLIEATIEFSDGSKRWCLITTPEKLLNHFNEREMEPPGFNIRHLIIVKSITQNDINRTLIHLDEQDEIMNATIPLYE